MTGGPLSSSLGQEKASRALAPGRKRYIPWVFPYEEDRDRPNLGYIRGDRWSLAVDAGQNSKISRIPGSRGRG